MVPGDRTPPAPLTGGGFDQSLNIGRLSPGSWCVLSFDNLLPPQKGFANRWPKE